MQMKSHYKHLAIELLIDAVIMFFVMYVMVDSVKNVYLNTNNLFMTLAMVAPMGLVMMIAMRSMYQNKKLNWVLYGTFAALFLVSFYAVRTQAGVGDAQFLRSMIPHHAGAILMCEEATLTDPDIVQLCKNILESQAREIDQMQKLLYRQ